MLNPRASRPRMPGYGLPKSRKGLLPWSWAVNHLQRSHNYWVHTTKPDGSPHAMPVWGLWINDRFYFSTGRQTRKSRNLAENHKCVVSNELADEAVIVEGRAEEVTDASLIKKLAGPYHKKYKPWTLDASLGPIYEVRPCVVFGLFEKKFLSSATLFSLFGNGTGECICRHAVQIDKARHTREVKAIDEVLKDFLLRNDDFLSVLCARFPPPAIFTIQIDKPGGSRPRLFAFVPSELFGAQAEGSFATDII